METKKEVATTKVGAQVTKFAAMTLPQIVDTAEKKFVELFSRIHGKDASNVYQVEKFHFMKLLQDKPALQKTSNLTKYGCFLDAAVDGLSFDPAKKHCYLVPMGDKMQRMISGYGELALRIQNGQIRHADNPVMVFDGDEFSFGIDNERPFLKHIRKIAKDGKEKAIACYMRITRTDGSIDYSVLTYQELMDLKKFSKQPDSPAWTTGLTGMWKNKTIKHAFRNYPKLVVHGAFSKPQAIEETPETIDYGIEIIEEKPDAIKEAGKEKAREEKAKETPIIDFVDETPAATGSPVETVTFKEEEEF